MLVAKWSWTILLVALLVVVRSVPSGAQVSDGYGLLPDSGFIDTPLEGMPVGLHFGAQAGPRGGPYRHTEFFQGVTSTEAYGQWDQRDNTWGLCFNLDRCTGARILPDLYDFAWTWESAFDGGPDWPNLIENNINIRYADGSFHRPWALHVWTAEKQAVLNFSSRPGKVSFQVNQNGNVVIGTPFRQPAKQLEVVGDALVTRDFEVVRNVVVRGSVSVDGALEVGGSEVVTRSTSTSSGQVLWAEVDGVKMATASDICAASRLECRSGYQPMGVEFACTDALPMGTVAFALCR